jgi:hypothetical protein
MYNMYVEASLFIKKSLIVLLLLSFMIVYLFLFKLFKWRLRKVNH